jgi:hypothetical protein
MGTCDPFAVRVGDRSTGTPRSGPGLASVGRVNARAIALALGIAASSVALPADAEADRPVFLSVVGHGRIRFRMATGAAAPCDSSENRMLFDGWLAPGSYVVVTGADVVCYQNTSGALRESNWSESQMVATMIRRARWEAPRPTRIVILTD